MIATLERLRHPAAILLGVGALGLGILSLVHQDFALQWQPYPQDLPGRSLWGLASGAAAATGGALMLAPRYRWFGALVLAVFFALWVVALHVPMVAVRPVNVGRWNGLAEALVMAAGAFLVFRESRRAEGRDPMADLAIRAFGAACLVFGGAHFVYAEFTASMVPAWLPMRLELAYLTGAVHALTGLAMLIGIGTRRAAAAEALMMSSFVLLVHLPRVAAAPLDRLELTMLCIAATLSGAAWSLAASRSAR